MAKKTSNSTPLPILILIYAVLLHAMYSSLSTLVLVIWGDSVMGTIDSYGNRLYETRAEPNRSRIVSKGYWFIVNGKEYRGHVIYGSDEAWPSLDEGETRSERIRYLDVFPYINKPAMLCDFAEIGEVGIIYHILTPIGCLLLLLLVIRTARGGKKKTAAKRFAAKSATRVEHQVIEAGSDTGMFCPSCGNKLPEGAAFCPDCGAGILASASSVCPGCGAALPDDAEFCIDCGTAVTPASPEPMPPSRAAASAPPLGGAGLVGFSDRYNCPEILAAAEKNKKSSIGCLWILVLVPLIVLPSAGLLIDEMPFGDAMIIGVGISVVMLALNLLALRRSKQPMWEGVVVNKYSKERSKHGRDGSDYTYPEYTVVIRTDEGKKKTIVERKSGRNMYDYLSVGDRVRYHPMFGTYEKYDKSKDNIIYCNVCSMINPIQNDRCKRCNNLLFK